MKGTAELCCAVVARAVMAGHDGKASVAGSGRNEANDHESYAG